MTLVTLWAEMWYRKLVTSTCLRSEFGLWLWQTMLKGGLCSSGWSLGLHWDERCSLGASAGQHGYHCVVGEDGTWAWRALEEGPIFLTETFLSTCWPMGSFAAAGLWWKGLSALSHLRAMWWAPSEARLRWAPHQSPLCALVEKEDGITRGEMTSGCS